ncbi:D-alanyl-D-alanine carboxypeptidase (plasmid) [Mesorhizobium sp. 131-2-5]|uniref:serine hydrolase domain-containing protein n=1 Tax=Mesorhizobium sp. 131-2-5 TaxID=2744519 RepID=UPI0018EA3F58|nr:serine hydrolase domain-containing protein [Mesorhizobium sp. 131-2-5]BCH05722.1 D-alanyl-D-alanine carboxypeptidase [Mesorhizobium sp. 131-2-5]
MSTLNEQIQKILDDHVARGVIGVSLAIGTPGKDIALYQSGLADKFKKTRMRGDHLFRIASCTKTFIATGVHLLVQDGKVDLDEPITRWFPDLPRASEMPVRILLNHRSGLPDFETSMPMISDKLWTAEEVIDFSFKHGVQKEPWHGMEYSNTGYVLAGMIISAETGKPYSEHLRSRIFTPLGMKDTWVGTHETFPLEREARGYMHADDDDNPQWDISGAGDPLDGVWDTTEWFPLSGANGAGDMISTPRDVVTFLNALFDGRVLGEKQLAEMKDNIKPAAFPGSNTVANGHGILIMRYGDIEVKGHLGQIPGHTSIMGRDEKTGITAMLIQNSGAGDFESFYLKGINEPVGKVFAAARDDLLI